MQQQRGARSGSLTRSWRTGHCCALPARAAAQPQPCPHTRGSRHHQIMSAVPVCRRRRARTRGREECTSERAEDAGTAWERSHLSASGLALRLLIEVVGDGVLRWLFAVMNLAGALTSGIARPSRACTVGQQLPGARRAAGRGSNSQLCGGASASEARGFRGVGGGVVGAGSPASQSLSLRCLPCSFPQLTLRLRFCARLAHSFFSLVRVGVPPGLC